MVEELRVCNGTYVRGAGGWRYAWGPPVPGAVDLTLADLLTIGADVAGAEAIGAFRPLTETERRWLAGDAAAGREVLVDRRGGRQPSTGDLVAGMLAPELHVLAMLTLGDVAETARVSKATIDSYRHRGQLPPPQLVIGRTPLWARPVIAHWLAERPGSGWRRDIYEDPGVGASPRHPVGASETRHLEVPVASTVAG
jgi:hypothetical protein